MCGIQEGTPVHSEELGALGVKLDELKKGVDSLMVGVGVVVSNQQQQSSQIEELRRATVAKNDALQGKALARQDKERALEQFEIVLDGCEPEPFARGGQGTVHRAEFQGERVALKRMTLVGMNATKRSKVLKDFSTELAIMTTLRSPRRRSSTRPSRRRPATLARPTPSPAGTSICPIRSCRRPRTGTSTSRLTSAAST